MTRPGVPQTATQPLTPITSKHPLERLRVLLDAAGEQEENGLGHLGIRWPSGDLVWSMDRSAKGLRPARRHTDRYPVAVSAGNCRPQQRQDRCAASGPMRRQLRIAISGMQSGPRAVVLAATPSLNYRPFGG